LRIADCCERTQISQFNGGWNGTVEVALVEIVTPLFSMLIRRHAATPAKKNMTSHGTLQRKLASYVSVDSDCAT
jgi:hypothetical protein